MTLKFANDPANLALMLEIDKYYYAAKKYLYKEQFLAGFAAFDALVQLEPMYLRSGFFRQGVIKFISTPQTIADLQEFVKYMLKPIYRNAFPTALITEISLAKNQLLDAIKEIKDPAVQKQALWQMLSKDTFLGELFSIPRRWFAPSISRGTLREAAHLLQDILEIDAKNPPKTPVILDKKLCKFLVKCKNLKYYFPILWNEVKTQRGNLKAFNKSFPKPRPSFFYKPIFQSNTNSGFFEVESISPRLGRRHSA